MRKTLIGLFAAFSRSAFSVLLLAVLGATLGALIFFFGSPSSPESRAFVSSPEFLVWFAINVGLFALYPVALVFVWRNTTDLRRYARAHWLDLLLSSLTMIGLFFLPIKLGANTVGLRPFPLEHFSIKITLIEGVGLLAGALPLWIAMWLMRAGVEDDALKSAGAKGLSTYGLYRERLDQFLLLESLLLALFIFTSAAMRQMALALNMIQPSQYPEILLLLTGGYYTLLLALVYFPTEAALHKTGRSLVELYHPLVDPRDAQWSETYAGRKELEEFLELKLSAQQRFATLFTLLAPVASGAFSLLVGK